MTTIILFGGAFDPPHNGHAHMAQAATAELQPDKLLWIPTAHPPHREQAQASFQQRCEMVSLVIADEPRWELCTIENDRADKSYFIDTLNELNEQMGPAQFYVLIGQDQLENFTHWHQWQTIVEKSTLLVMPREGCHCKSLPQHDVHMLNAPALDACSTAIRQNLNTTLIPQTVYDYITKKALYR
jgi:nicotinate-nucleotide adenylyltransferase